MKISIVLAHLLALVATSSIVVVKNISVLNYHVETLEKSINAVITRWSIESDTGFYGYHLPFNSSIVKNLPGIEFIEDNLPFKIFQTETSPDLNPDESLIQTQTNAPWYLSRVSHRDLNSGSDFAFPSAAGSNVTVYIIDTGIDPFAEDFITGYNNETNCYNTRVELLYPTDGPTYDDNGHGTFVASLAAGKIHGTAKNAKIVSLKALDSNGEGDSDSIISALEWVASRTKQGNENFGKSVVNLSVGSSRSRSVNRAVEALINQGVPVVAAAGNEATSACSTSPASANEIIAVGSINSKDYLSSFSNTGSCVSLLAPGEDITAAGLQQTGNCNSVNRNQKTESGTSFSSPLVAGIVANYLAYDNSLSISRFSRSSGSAYVSDVRNQLIQEQATSGKAHLDFHFVTPNKIAYSYPYGLGAGQ